MGVFKRKPCFRKLVLTVLRWLQCAMIFQPFYVMLMRLVFQGEVMEYFLQSLFFVGSCGVLLWMGDRLKYMWQYLLGAALVLALALRVTGNWIALVLTALLAAVKFCGRLSKSKIVFDEPHLHWLVVFVITAVYSGTTGCAPLQLASVIFIILYVALYLLYRALSRLDRYLDINAAIDNFPGKRIGRSFGVIFAVACLVLLAVTVTAAVADYSFIEVRGAGALSAGPPPAPGAIPYQRDRLLEYLMGNRGEASKPMALLQNIVMVPLAVLAAVCVIYAVCGMSRRFRNRRTAERDDVIESSREDAEPYRKEEKRTGIRRLDPSLNAYVRRRYVERVRRSAQGSPEAWRSPREVEAFAGIENQLLHELYEKARYSKGGCTEADKKQLKNSAGRRRAK